MEFCGGHTHAISRYGIEDLLPANVHMIHGPGCPVCVLPIGRIDRAIRLVERPEVIALHLRRPDARARSHGTSLLGPRRAGADIRMVYSALDALRSPGAARARNRVLRHRLRDHDAADRGCDRGLAAEKVFTNFSVFCNHVLTPVGDQNILESPEVRELGRCHRRLHRTRARQHSDRHRALRVLRRGIREASCGRRLRATRCDAGDPDAGPPGQRGPRTR